MLDCFGEKWGKLGKIGEWPFSAAVPLHRSQKKPGRRAWICRLQEGTRAESRDRHVQTRGEQ